MPITRRKMLSSLAAASSATAFAPSAVRAATALRLGSRADVDMSPYLYAQSVGWFQAAGLDLDLQIISSGAAVGAATIGGTVDLGRSSLFSAINAHAHGIPLVLVAGNSLEPSTSSSDGILVLAGSPIRRPADLNGKTVSAAALNDIMVALIRAWIDKNGGKSETTHFVELTGPAIGSALDTGRLDAAGLLNPDLSNLLATGKYRLLGSPASAMGSGYLIDGWMATTDYVRRNAPTVKSFVDVLSRACTYVNANPHQVDPLLAQLTKIDVGTIAKMSRPDFATALDPRGIQLLISIAARYQIIPQSFDAREIIASI